MITITLIGDPGGIRTHDPLIKSQMLYRLSYGIFQGRIGGNHRNGGEFVNKY